MAVFLVLTAVVFSEVLTYRKTSAVVDRLTQETLQSQLNGVRLALDLSSKQETSRLQSLIKSASAELLPKLRTDDQHRASLEVENQETHGKVRLQVPPLLFDGKPMVTSDIADRISRETATAVTFFIATDEGLLRVATTVINAKGERAINTFIPKTSAVTKAILSGQPYSGRAKVVGQWYVAAYVPIMNAGQIVGAFFMGFPETSTVSIREHLKNQKLLQTGYFYILDANGGFVLHPSLEGENVLEKTDLDGRPVFKEILAAKTGSINYRWLNAETNSPQDKIAIFDTYPEIGWTVVGSLNLSEAKADVYDLRALMFYVGLAVMIVMIVITWFFTSFLAKDFIQVSSRLESALSHINGRSVEVQRSASNLAESSNNQASGVQETAATLEEVRSTIASNMQMTVRSEELSTLTAKAAEDGARLMGQVSHAIHEVSTGNTNTFNRIKESYKRIGQISDVLREIDSRTSTINDIVFQTKLLSFNASVEAARAGEHGKGFAVVAEEIGKLAAMTGTTATEINKIMLDSIASVDNMITSSEREVLESFEAAASSITSTVEISSKTTEALADILDRSKLTNENMKQISLASKEQAAAVDQIAAAVDLIEKGAQDTANSVIKANEISTGLNEEVDELSAINDRIQLIVLGGSSETGFDDVKVGSIQSKGQHRKSPRAA